MPTPPSPEQREPHHPQPRGWLGRAQDRVADVWDRVSEMSRLQLGGAALAAAVLVAAVPAAQLLGNDEPEQIQLDDSHTDASAYNTSLESDTKLGAGEFPGITELDEQLQNYGPAIEYGIAHVNKAPSQIDTLYAGLMYAQLIEGKGYVYRGADGTDDRIGAFGTPREHIPELMKLTGLDEHYDDIWEIKNPRGLMLAQATLAAQLIKSTEGGGLAASAADIITARYPSYDPGDPSTLPSLTKQEQQEIFLLASHQRLNDVLGDERAAIHATRITFALRNPDSELAQDTINTMILGANLETSLEQQADVIEALGGPLYEPLEFQNAIYAINGVATTETGMNGVTGDAAMAVGADTVASGLESIATTGDTLTEEVETEELETATETEAETEAPTEGTEDNSDRGSSSVKPMEIDTAEALEGVGEVASDDDLEQALIALAPASHDGPPIIDRVDEPDFSARPNITVDGSPPGAHKDSNCTSGFTEGAASMKNYINERWAPPVTSIGEFSCRAIVCEDEPCATSIHGLGRAVDVMIDAETAEGLEKGNEIRNFLIHNAEAFGIQQIIWNRGIWTANQDGWRAYTGPHDHVNHLHIEVNKKASENPNLFPIQ
jgi:hypothetical protein